MEKIDHALALAERGFPVFPLRPNSKLPLVAGWHDIATTDPLKIRAIWSLQPDANIGIAVGKAGVGVIDLDEKNGKHGTAAFRELCAGSCPATLTFRTASGGRHMLFADPDNLFPNKAGDLGEGIDTRGLGGLIVGPGSTIDGAAYTIEHDAPIAAAPAWLLTRFTEDQGRRAEKLNLDRLADYDGPLDAESDVAEAIRRIDRDLVEAGEPVEGDSSDARAYTLANWLLDLPLTGETVLALMRRWAPNFTASWLERKIANALEYRVLDTGVEHVQTGSEMIAAWNEAHAVPAPAKATSAHKFSRIGIGEMRRSRLIDFFDANRMLPRYEQGGVIMAYGASGSHKTNVILSWLHDLILADPLLSVCYAAGEGIQGLGPRFRAQGRYRGLAEDDIATERFSKTEMPALLSTSHLADYAAFLEATGGADIIVVDTFATGLQGEEEDQRAAHLLTMTGGLGLLATRLRALVIVVHHTGWDQKHMRGASGFWSNSSGVLRFEANTPQAATYCQVFAEHIKDGGGGHRAHYALVRDPVEGVPIPVQCTEAEYNLFVPDPKKPLEHVLSYSTIRATLQGLHAFDIASAKPAIQIANTLLPLRPGVNAEDHAKSADRIRKVLEDKGRTELAGLCHVVDASGALGWFAR